jgi:hypothetical protein
MRFRALLVAVPVALLAASAAQAYTTFYGTAGPGTTIVLKRADGTVVKNARHGNKTFVIRDRSAPTTSTCMAQVSTVARESLSWAREPGRRSS